MHSLAKLDHAHVWHPFTQMRDWAAAEPLIIARAEGNELIDVDGRRYLDGVSSLTWTSAPNAYRWNVIVAVPKSLLAARVRASTPALAPAIVRVLTTATSSL